MKFLLLLWISFLIAFVPSFLAFAQHAGHQMPAPGGEKKAESAVGKETSPSRTFLIDNGLKASFTIMAMAEHIKMLKDMKMKVVVDPQATHNISVTLIDTRFNQPIRDAVVKMKVVSPKGKEQIKLLDAIPAMNQYSGDFTLSEKGRYQILILFKSSAQKKAAGFYYTLQ